MSFSLASALRLASARAFSISSIHGEALKFAVVGSGPAGFYTVDRLLKRFQGCSVDIVEALPTPFGLVRSGVAPDHQDTKNVINQFTDLARRPEVGFFGNVRVGAEVSLPELRSFYNAVVLAYGADSDRRLGVPGEALGGVHPAREFVQWYNGHPSAVHLPIDLRSVRSVAICGLGNVAVDCARVLLQPVTRIAASDAAEHAVAALRESGVTDVHLIGRRGPAQAAFTPKELRELLDMEGVGVEILPAGCLELSEACQAEVKANRIKRRVVEVLTKAEKGGKTGPRTLHLHFLGSPTEILESPFTSGTASGVRLEHTQLQPGADGSAQRAVASGVRSDLPAELILTSIGYRSVPMEGAAFDPAKSVIPNVLGQAMDGCSGSSCQPDAGLFVCGWLKRGPSGIIGTNLLDAEQTVDTMVQRQATFPKVRAALGGGEGLQQLLSERGAKVVDFEGWERIDAEERRRGEAKGKPREKIVMTGEMLAVAEQAKRAH